MNHRILKILNMDDFKPFDWLERLGIANLVSANRFSLLYPSLSLKFHCFTSLFHHSMTLLSNHLCRIRPHIWQLLPNLSQTVEHSFKVVLELT